MTTSTVEIPTAGESGIMFTGTQVRQKSYDETELAETKFVRTLSL